MTPQEALVKPVTVRDPETGETARVTRLDELGDGTVRVQMAVRRDRGWSLPPRIIPADADLEMVGGI